jgi:tripeptidyl-peptidase-1
VKLVWLNYLRSQEEIPQVISTSYGDDEPTLPKSYAQRVCRGFAQLGARGVSVLFSAGDHGVAGRNGTCPGGKFVPHFPASCPWVTAVGGTRGAYISIQNFTMEPVRD